MSDLHATSYMTPDLKNGLPKLRVVAPLTYAICWIFVAINVIIAFALAFVYDPTVPIAITGKYFTFDMWAIVFTILSIGNGYGLIRNKWRITKSFLIYGLLVKMFWEYALIIRTIEEPKSTIMLTVLWTFFALVQACTYIWFMPPVDVGRKVE